LAKREAAFAQQALRVVDEVDGFWCSVPDASGTRGLSKTLMMFHLGMMALFLTVVLAPFAWLAAVYNILRSPKVACWIVRCNQHGISLRRVIAREFPLAYEGPDVASAGTLPLGLGEPPQEQFMPFSELEELRWDDVGLRLRVRGGSLVRLDMEQSSPEHVAKLGQRLHDAWRQAQKSFDLSVEQSKEEEKKLRKLAAKGQKQL